MGLWCYQDVVQLFYVGVDICVVEVSVLVVDLDDGNDCGQFWLYYEGGNEVDQVGEDVVEGM